MAGRWIGSCPGSPGGKHGSWRNPRCWRGKHLAGDDREDDEIWFSHDACTGRCTITAFGYTSLIRAAAAQFRCEALLSTIENTYRAEAYGMVLITWPVRAVNGTMPVVGSTRPIR